MRFPDTNPVTVAENEARYRFSIAKERTFTSQILDGIRSSIAELKLPEDIAVRFDVPFQKPHNEGIFEEADLRNADVRYPMAFLMTADHDHHLELVMTGADETQQKLIMEAVLQWPAIGTSNPTGITAEEQESEDSIAA